MYFLTNDTRGIIRNATYCVSFIVVTMLQHVVFTCMVLVTNSATASVLSAPTVIPVNYYTMTGRIVSRLYSLYSQWYERGLFLLIH